MTFVYRRERYSAGGDKVNSDGRGLPIIPIIINSCKGGRALIALVMIRPSSCKLDDGAEIIILCVFNDPFVPIKHPLGLFTIDPGRTG